MSSSFRPDDFIPLSLHSFFSSGTFLPVRSMGGDILKGAYETILISDAITNDAEEKGKKKLLICLLDPSASLRSAALCDAAKTITSFISSQTDAGRAGLALNI